MEMKVKKGPRFYRDVGRCGVRKGEGKMWVCRKGGDGRECSG